MAPMAQERILIRHPKTKNTTSVTVASFDKAWSKRGWEKVDENLDDLTKEQLQELAKKAGVSVSGTKDDIAARIKEASSQSDPDDDGQADDPQES